MPSKEEFDTLSKQVSELKTALEEIKAWVETAKEPMSKHEPNVAQSALELGAAQDAIKELNVKFDALEPALNLLKASKELEPNASKGEGELSQAERTMCERLGISEEDFKQTKGE